MTDARLAEIVSLHERQRAMHAERGEIKAACVMDDILAYLTELRRLRDIRRAADALTAHIGAYGEIDSRHPQSRAGTNSLGAGRDGV